MTRRTGFTLIEVMIALLIFALLAAAGVLVLSQSIDNRFVVKEATDRTAQLQRLRATLRADLGQAAPRRVRAANGQPAFAPILAAEAPGDPLLVLVRAGWSNPDGRPRASLQRVEYRLVEDRLERRVYPYLDGARPGPPQILYQGVSAPSLAFISEGTEAPRFVPTPDRPLPDAVRLDLTLEGYGPVRQLFVVGGGR
ncbi:type II secretion system minor pseudopilin GspJ [Brevundimonas sp. NPDC046655]|uniref:type II secretion system minor pseudopilin GspJ n=1 Tax=unclassified Brevundimonas TaxID=2622653 RepID=UPI00384F2BA4